jgi:hypothetical protein
MTTINTPVGLSTEPTGHPQSRSRRIIGRILLVLAVLWSAGVVVAGLASGVGVVEFPARGESLLPTLLESTPQPAASILVALIAAVGLAIGVWMLAAEGAGRGQPLRPRQPLSSGRELNSGRPLVPAIYAGTLVAFVTLVAVDARLMAFIGYTLSLNLDLPRTDILHQGILLLGALLWIGAAATLNRRHLAARQAEGSGLPRGPVNGRPVSPLARIAALLALVVPALYAFTRVSWALGFPLGLPEDMYESGLAVGLWWRGLGLAIVAVGAGVLTLGLVQRWGEVFPRWLPVLRGRVVPVGLAVVPGTAAALVILSGGLTFVRSVLSGEVTLEGNWAAIGPELLWPLWGAAVAVATLAYYRRRTGR